MTEDEFNAAFERGQKSAYQEMLALAMRGLMFKGQTFESLVAERAATVMALRAVCADHGDNDWEDNLHLADVVEKHLGRHLDASCDPDTPSA